ncbi:MAG: 23S rRNA (adenine(2030)-N(6))-methyltransferase RlmJ [Wenzhouxiangella sp.]|nr:23S rRNA (adenine(2030)-N(6))-methyltransferase RlmJ [Wenzhouxiangella sp.]MCH8477675.1 23S rRNA (adenine(2030)-N(6))-methyltransferase RlmJ [Wenzhouxiangella sp.]
MLSYRHGYHAGNPADVFKHSVLVALVRAMQAKPRGILFIDTHAGAGGYQLDSEIALKTAEFRAGIGALWHASDLDPIRADYLDQVRSCNPDGQLRHYPGSPELVRNLLRREDRLVLCDLHPAEQATLRERFGKDRQVRVISGDGYAALRGLLPPPGGRGLVLIDPSWELKDEAARLEAAMQQALRRFAHGVYAIWYPLIEGRDIDLQALPQRLGLGPEQWLDLCIRFPQEQRLGRMFASGMAIINCPYRLRQTLVDWHSTLR